MDQSAEEYGYQLLASTPRPKQDAANCGLGNAATITPFRSRSPVLISVYLAANRNNRGASPRDLSEKRNFRSPSFRERHVENMLLLELIGVPDANFAFKC
jgi:hypothetical protein